MKNVLINPVIQLKLILVVILTTSITSCDYFAEKAQDVIPKTKMHIDDPIRYYYPVIRGEKLLVSYKFKNTGRDPLIISDVQASCGCITTNKYNRPVPPNGTGYIEFEYNSYKNIGFVEHHVLIKANVDSTFKNEVRFMTNVVPSSHYIRDYEEIYTEEMESKGEELVEGDSKQWYFVPTERKEGLRKEYR